jgi:large subunit ribosomal protein L23
MTLVITPRLSEKGYSAAADLNTYVFNVPLASNKIEIKKAVEALYNVKVQTVNIVRMQGKTKRTVRKGGRQITGKRIDFKKAYVLLENGQSIPVFAAEEGDK